MPNHCCNTLKIAVDAMPVILKNYIRKDGQGEKIFDFELIEPVGDVPDWYEQRNEKWGTKWVGYDLNIGDYDIEFYTAWSPPIPIIKKLAELHKDFVFRLEYYETLMGFRGVATAKWKDGEVLLDDQCWDMTEKDLSELGFDEPLDGETEIPGPVGNITHKREIIQITVMSFPAWNAIMIYPETEEKESGIPLAPIEKDLREYFSANKEKYYLWESDLVTRHLNKGGKR